jgi:hypothetical protein
VTPSDFGIYVNNLPRKRSQHEVKEYFERVMDNLVEVEEVNFTYQIDELITLTE